MSYQYEDVLRAKAEAFCEVLKKAGVTAYLPADAFRNFQVKLAVGNAGYLNLYYSPNKQSYTLVSRELKDASVAALVDELWMGQNQASNKSQHGYYAYIDGSFMNGITGFGAVIIHDDIEIHSFAGTINQSLEARQVAGELQAVVHVLDWCTEHNLPEITIVYDYEGVEKWATGDWRARNALTQQYVQALSSHSTQIIWQKVKSHSGDHWNEVVDRIAKEACATAQSPLPAHSRVQEVADYAQKFVTYLHQHDFPARYIGVFNEQYGRIEVSGGYFDLYNTAKRPLAPHYNGFTDRALAEYLSELWVSFREGESASRVDKQALNWEEVNYYLRLFKPFRNYRFDFGLLLEAIERTLSEQIKDPARLRYDYNALEALVQGRQRQHE